MKYTAAEVDAGQQRSCPGHGAFARIEMNDVRVEKNAESVTDSVHHEIADERWEDDDPAPAAVRRYRNIIFLLTK